MSSNAANRSRSLNVERSTLMGDAQQRCIAETSAGTSVHLDSSDMLFRLCKLSMAEEISA